MVDIFCFETLETFAPSLQHLEVDDWSVWGIGADSS